MGEQSDARRKLMMRCKELQMSRQERIDLAEYLLRRDVQSYQHLDEEQVRRLLDAFEGHYLLNELLGQRVDY